MLARRHKRRGPEGHDGVADVFVDDAAAAADRLGHDGEVAVDDGHEGVWCQVFTDGREVLDIGEEHGDLAAIGGCHHIGALEQIFDDARIDVLSKGRFDALLDTQFAHHVVERMRQGADLVSGGDRYSGIEVPLLNCLGALDQAPNGPHHAGSDERRKEQARDRGNDGDEEVQPENAVLVFGGCLNRRPREPLQGAAHFVEGPEQLPFLACQQFAQRVVGGALTGFERGDDSGGEVFVVLMLPLDREQCRLYLAELEPVGVLRWRPRALQR